MGRKKTLSCLISSVFAATLLVSLENGCGRDQRIVVGSKNFTEQVVLGEIIAQHLEHRLGKKVTRKLNLGGTLLAHQALLNKEIDLYPEYTGTALTAILKFPPSSDAAVVLKTVSAEYLSRFRIQWLDPLGFNNTFAIVIRSENSRRLGIRSLTEAVQHRAGWRLGVGYEFQQRPDGLIGFLKAYPIRLKGKVQTMDLGLLYTALEQKQVDMVAGNATDGVLSVLNATLLEDDKHYFPPYQAAIAVRAEILANHPQLLAALNELSGKFSETQMRQLNYQIDGKHLPLGEVAMEFLRQAGLLR